MARKDRYDYFAALHEIAMQCTESAQLLSEVVSRLDKDAAEAEETIAKGKLITNKSEALLAKLFERAAADFITPLDRGDMIELARTLNSVTDLANEAIQLSHIVGIEDLREGALELTSALHKSCETLAKAVYEFRAFKKSEKLKQLVVDVNSYEEEADSLYILHMRMLHLEVHGDMLYVFKWSRLFTQIERCCDACENAADLLKMIALKNS